MLFIILALTLLAVGVIQTISVTLRYITLKDHATPYGRSIIRYYKIVALYFILLAGLFKYDEIARVDETIWGLYLFFIPLVMACYYWNILRNAPRTYPEMV